MIHLALLADAALLLVLLRMVWIGADKSCPREFFFLLSLLCYALLSFAEDFPAWGHATLAFFALPMLLAVTGEQSRPLGTNATKKLPASRSLGTRLIAALAVSAAAMLFGPASLARWGNSPAASWALLGALLELAAGVVLVMSAFQDFKKSAISRLRFFIGAHLVLVNLAAFTGTPFPLSVFAATLLWLITAAFLAPRLDALVNEGILALAYGGPAGSTSAENVAAARRITPHARRSTALWKYFDRASGWISARPISTSTKSFIALVPARMASAKQTSAAVVPNFANILRRGKRNGDEASKAAMKEDAIVTTKRANSAGASPCLGASLMRGVDCPPQGAAKATLSLTPFFILQPNIAIDLRDALVMLVFLGLVFLLDWRAEKTKEKKMWLEFKRWGLLGVIAAAVLFIGVELLAWMGKP